MMFVIAPPLGGASESVAISRDYHEPIIIGPRNDGEVKRCNGNYLLYPADGHRDFHICLYLKGSKREKEIVITGS